MPHAGLPPAEDLKLVTLADIARGGMGTVQLCRVANGRLAGRHLAVKRLNPAIEQEPEFVNMFLDETWITARIASPHVVRVEAWGQDSDGMYLAVELVEGVSLSRLIKESKEKEEPFAERTVANLMSQVCSGLEGAHGLAGDNGAPLGLVHRDLTPGNILVGFDGMVKIADFGIAKAEERLTSTRIGMMKGKPAYMAPEQARGGGIDARADLFALGVMTYELLSGQRPWAGKNDLEVLVAVSTTDPVDITEHRKVSQVFVDITRRCLKKRPSDRYASATEIKAALDGWRRERGFDRDDAASLAAFVRRNTPEQQRWFKEALGGALAQGGVTFSDLEDKIDKGRKGDGAQDSRPRTVSGVMRAAEQAAIDRAAAPRPAPPAPPASGKLDEIDDNARTQYMPQGGSPATDGGGRGAVPVPAPTPRLGNAPGYAPKLASTVALSPEEADSRLAASRPASHRGQMAPQSAGASTILAEPIPASQIPASGMNVPAAGAPASQAPFAWGVPQAPQAGAAALGPTSLGPLSQARVSAMPIAATPPMGGPASSPFSAPYSAPISSGPVSPAVAPAPTSAPMARTAPNKLAATINDDGRRRSGGRIGLYFLVVAIFCAAGGTIAWLLTHGLPTK
ncbi:MAG TPA: protein kinase [Polyangiaceae bacterium]|nr:protein kinase [Polyangiaceae bacterium]